MASWKDLAGRLAQKRRELEDEAKKRALRKAAEVALQTGKAAARAAAESAGKTLDHAGKMLGEALFGPSSIEDATPKPAPDPFAKLKAEEEERKLAASKERQDVTAREHARAQAERDVDDELAALKKKLRG